MKTTKAHFKYFEERVRYWLEDLGLLDWTLYFDHKEIDAAAQVSYNYMRRGATFTLSTKLILGTDQKITPDYLSEIALHESLHLIAAELCFLAEERYITEDNIRVASESLVARLTTTLWRATRKD